MKKARIRNRILEVFLWALGLIWLIPFVLVLLTSLKDRGSAALFQLSLPEVWHWENYKVVWEEGEILQGFKNSVLISVPTVGICVIFSSMLAFWLARVKSKLSKAVYMFVIMGMTVPMVIVTTFVLLKDIHLLNTHLGVILVEAALQIPLTTFIMVGFIEGLPKELDEAATIDGCGPYRMFWQIILPLLKPVLFTTMILVLMNSWNDSQVPLYFLTDNTKWPMPLNINRFSLFKTKEWHYIFGSVFLSTFPVLVAYIFGQKYIIEGMTAGSVKG